MIKKLLLTVFISQLIGSSCLAADLINVKLGRDYLILSDDGIKNTLVSKPDILTLSPFFTIFNDKNVILLHPEKTGTTDVTILFEKEYSSLKFQVLAHNANIPDITVKKDGLEIILLDNLPESEDIELDTPTKTKD